MMVDIAHSLILYCLLRLIHYLLHVLQRHYLKREIFSIYMSAVIDCWLVQPNRALMCLVFAYDATYIVQITL